MDLGDKSAHKSLSIWGTIIIALDGIFVLVDQTFGGILPKPWNTLIPGAAGATGWILTQFGLRRAIGKVAANGKIAANGKAVNGAPQ